jgi:hypothetical protein
MPIRSRWSNQFKELSNQSKFHEKVRHILTTDSLLKAFSCYQEVPVKDLCPEYSDNHYFDWYIQELNMIVELHGAQHYSVVNYGNIGYEDAIREFNNIQKRDSQKKEAAKQKGMTYVEISYKEYSKLDAARFKQLIFEVTL